MFTSAPEKDKVQSTCLRETILQVEKDCEPCDNSGLKSQATRYCKKCDEYLCEKCVQTHKTFKATRQHLTITIQTKEKSKRLQLDRCEQCEDMDEKDVCGLSENCKKQKETKNDSVEEKQKPEDRPTIKEGNENQKQANKNFSKTTPGQPRASDVDVDPLNLSWYKPSVFKDGDVFEVRFKNIDINGDLEILTDEFSTATCVATATGFVRRLKPKTRYVFRVRGVHNNEKGPFSEISKAAYTTTSPTVQLDMFSKIAEEGKPSPTKYILPITEIQNARNTKAKTRKFDVGRPIGSCEEKTILIVGAEGSGKSTLVDWMINHAFGVNWEDKFRFTTEDKEENQHSLTEWVNCYSIHPGQGRRRLPYRLNIIDTPGFNGFQVAKNQKVVEQIRQFFTEKPPTGVSCIDAICFHIDAQDKYRAYTQRYIYQSVMSLFGKDIEKNSCCFVTFANGNDKGVLSAMLQSGLPFDKCFTFDKFSLFANNEKCFLLSRSVWKEGERSFKDFFNCLVNNMDTKSLQLANDNLNERLRLITIVSNLESQLDGGSLKVNEMEQEIRIIEEKKDIEYEELTPGLYTTYCNHCPFACHENCRIMKDDDKSPCRAMKKGICNDCPNKCEWKTHSNVPVKKTYYSEIKKYQEASGKLLTHAQVLEKMHEVLADLKMDEKEMMIHIRYIYFKRRHMIYLEKMKNISRRSEAPERAQILSSDEDFNKVAMSHLGAAETTNKKNKVTCSIC